MNLAEEYRDMANRSNPMYKHIINKCEIMASQGCYECKYNVDKNTSVIKLNKVMKLLEEDGFEVVWKMYRDNTIDLFVKWWE